MDRCYMAMFLICLVGLGTAYSDMGRLVSGSDVYVHNLPEDIDLYIPAVPIRKDKGFVYVTCDNNTVQSKSSGMRVRPEVRCTLHLVTPNQMRMCQFLYNPGKSKGIEDMSFRPFGEEKVLVLILEIDEHQTGLVRINILEWEDCSVHQISLPSIITADQGKKIDVLSDKFHVTLKNNSMCHDLDECKITFNSDGKRTGKPATIPEGYSAYHEVFKQPKSQDEGLFGYGTLKSDGKIHVTYTDEDGIQKTLAIVGHKPGYYTTSNDHDLYALCIPTGTYGPYGQQFWCLQYDWRTGKSINITFDGYGVKSHNRSEFRTLGLVNLEMGRFLATTVECDSDALVTGLCNSVHFSIVNSTGNVEKSTPIPINLNCNGTFTLMDMRYDFSETDDEYCFNLLCSNSLTASPAHRFISFYEKCIPKMWI